jgi:hypothetical protein
MALKLFISLQIGTLLSELLNVYSIETAQRRVIRVTEGTGKDLDGSGCVPMSALSLNVLGRAEET